MPTIPEILADFIGTPPAPITPDADLRADLLLDNLDLLELALTIEDELNLSLDEERVARCRTVADLERLVGHGDTQKTGIGPCDKCGSNDDCRCGPCQCKWCRHERGEATALEQAQIKRALEDRSRPILKDEARNV